MTNLNSAVLDKIKKLLSLSTSSNEHEAQRAADKVQELLSLHSLSMDDVAKESDSDVEELEVLRSKQTVKWRQVLLANVAGFYDCRALVIRRSYVVTSVIGSQGNVIVTKLMYDYFVKAVDKLAREERANGGKATPSFRLGAALRISGKLKERKNQMQQEGFKTEQGLEVSGLAVQSQSENYKRNVAEWMAKHYPKTKRVVTNHRDSNSMSRGFSAGDSVGVDTQVNGSTQLILGGQ